MNLDLEMMCLRFIQTPLNDLKAAGTTTTGFGTVDQSVPQPTRLPEGWRKNAELIFPFRKPLFFGLI